MKQLLFLFLIVPACTCTLAAQGDGPQATLTVTITNLGDKQGQLMVGIFDSEDTFLEKPIAGKTVKVSHEGQQVVFENVPAGEYAVSVIQDENENGELDSFLVIPTEPYGFSKNVMGRMGPPSFEQAKFPHQEDTVIEIKLNR